MYSLEIARDGTQEIHGSASRSLKDVVVVWRGKKQSERVTQLEGSHRSSGRGWPHFEVRGLD